MAQTSTLLLDQLLWDLVVGTDGNIAVASQPYSLAQDAASAIKTFVGECYWDTTIGVPYLSQVLSKRPTITLLKSLFVQAALTVPGIAAAEFFISTLDARTRTLTGQVQVVSSATGMRSVAPVTVTFATLNPQGAG